MADGFMGEIRLFSFNYPPKGWAKCDGQLLPINQNQALFSLLGTMYGGNGQTNFALPNLRGQVPIHLGQGHTQGEAGGQQSQTLNIQQLPTHNHFLNGSTTAATTVSPDVNTVLSASNPQSLYASASNLTAMAPNAIGNTGGSQAHQNMQPFLVMNYCIYLQGVFPSRN